MSVTKTITQHPAVVYVTLKMRGPQDPLTQENILSLAEIFNKYQESWDDPLSNRLSDWTMNVFKHGLEIQKDTLAQLVEDLRSKILINPIDNAFLQEPVLERQWLWDAKMLKCWRGIKSESVFDNVSMEAEKVHEYAVAIIRWAEKTHGMYQPKQDGKLDCQLQSQPSDPTLTQLKIISFVHMAKNVLLSQQLEQQKNRADLRKQLWKEAKKWIDEEVEKAKKRADANREEIDNRMDRMQQSNDGLIRLLHIRIDRQKTELEITKKYLKQTEEECEKQAIRINTLQAQVFYLAQKIKQLEASSGRGRLFGIF